MLFILQADIRETDMTDEQEEKILFLRHQVKELREEVKELRQIMNALAHAVALLEDTKKKKPNWIDQYYRTWENKHKEWFNV